MRLTKMIQAYEADSQRLLTNFQAKCPECGDYLEEDNCFDTITSNGWVERLIVGYCPTCDKGRNVFFFGGISDLHES